MTQSEQTRVEKFIEDLDKTEREEVYQKALEKTSILIPREFVQNHGVHFDLVFRKLRLAENYVTDFLYLSKSSTDWNVVFIELEKPWTPFFKEGTDDLSPEFHEGLNQIDRWRAWVSVNGNLDHMFAETLEPIWRPTAMRSNPQRVKFVLVTGRRAEFAGDARRRNLITAKERDDFKILSYDSLLNGARHNRKLYVAKRLNSHIQILSDEFISENLFAWVDPTRLEISQALHDDAFASKSKWVHVESDMKTKSLDAKLPKIKISS